MKTIYLPARLLVAADACPKQVATYRKLFPRRGAPLTPDGLAACVAAGLDVSFALRLLTPAARAEYERVRGLAGAEYERVQGPAWAEYVRGRGLAWAEYVRVRGLALAEYERVQGLAWAEYVRVTGLALLAGLIVTLGGAE
jgi:hypothetical protein